MQGHSWLSNKDTLSVGAQLGLDVPKGKNGSLVIVIGECKSCSIKHIDFNFLTRAKATGYQPVFIETMFFERATPKKEETFKSYPIKTIPWDNFKLLTSTFLPRLVLVDGNGKIITRQINIDEAITLPK